MSKRGGIFKGLLLGGLLGAAAGILFAPKAGKETREELKTKLNELKDKAEDMYKVGRKEVLKRVKQLKEAGSKLDEKVYLDIVKSVVETLKEDKKLDTKVLNRLTTQLEKDWNTVKGSFEEKKEVKKK